jgi:hypothetical protein
LEKGDAPSPPTGASGYVINTGRYRENSDAKKIPTDRRRNWWRVRFPFQTHDGRTSHRKTD